MLLEASTRELCLQGLRPLQESCDSGNPRWLRKPKDKPFLALVRARVRTSALALRNQSDQVYQHAVTIAEDQYPILMNFIIQLESVALCQCFNILSKIFPNDMFIKLLVYLVVTKMQYTNTRCGLARDRDMKGAIRQIAPGVIIRASSYQGHVTCPITSGPYIWSATYQAVVACPIQTGNSFRPSSDLLYPSNCVIIRFSSYQEILPASWH